ncbi:uncharacterized protein LOC127845454 isoform X9 [Dreissena polymorpha]|nr:uncharacterized protein LOC127845454 isoform X8 [Dreissena polymorpha]XP_052232338.1 uncharacterized protein LOC127845454 isoform X9 [Dreissena polymorpha]
MEMEVPDTDPVVDDVATTRNLDQLTNTSAMEMEVPDTDPVVDDVATTRESRYPVRASTSKAPFRRESFIYYGPKRVKETHCLCNMPDDGREYWQCEGCLKWFHPECVGESVEPEKYTCASCSHKDLPQEKIFEIPELFKTIIDEEEQGEGTFFICAKDACDNMAAGISRASMILNHVGSSSPLPWMNSANQFMAGNRQVKNGFGFAIFSCVAIECVRHYIKDELMEQNEDEPYYSVVKQLRGVKDPNLKAYLAKDKYMHNEFITEVLLPEALIGIFQAFTKCSYQEAHTECSCVVGQSALKALKNACEISESKRTQLMRKYASSIGS